MKFTDIKSGLMDFPKNIASKLTPKYITIKINMYYCKDK